MEIEHITNEKIEKVIGKETFEKIGESFSQTKDGKIKETFLKVASKIICLEVENYDLWHENEILKKIIKDLEEKHLKSLSIKTKN